MTIWRFPHELVSGLDDLGETETHETPGEIVDVIGLHYLVSIQVRLAQEGGVVSGCP